MIKPYNAVGLIPTVWGISKHEDIFRNIEHHRCNSKWTNWMKDLKNEMYQIIYEQVTRRQIALMLEKDIWKK